MARGSRKKTLTDQYKPYLCRLMAFKDGLERPYHTGVEFTQQQLLSITPDDIAKLMKKMAYNTTTPGPDDHPTYCRSTNLEFVKKAVSYFMPHKYAYWNIESCFGNPTKSNVVNDVIKAVRLAEVRKQGVPSKAKRDLTKPEFELTLRILEQDPTGDPGKTRVGPWMCKFHVHLIARTDDISNIETTDLSHHPRFSDCALETKVSWSKNVTDERACPPQIILGSNDPNFCCQVAAACNLEERIGSGEQSKFLFGEPNRNDDDESNRINDKYTRMLRQIWNENKEMVDLILKNKGSLGSHSMRKFAATWCSQHGCSDIEVEVRGRWRNKKNGRVVNRYINPEQVPADTKVAGILCVGGPVKYKLKKDSNVTHHFLIDSVVPNIAQFYGSDPSNRIADVLAPALLWACHEDGLEHLVAPELREKVRRAYSTIEGDKPDDYNPVIKVPLHIYRVENDVRIEEAVFENDNNDDERVIVGGTIDGRSQLIQEKLQTVIIKQHQMDERIRENYHQLQASISGIRNYCSKSFNTINRNMTRYYVTPVRPVNRIGHARAAIRQQRQQQQQVQQQQEQEGGNDEQNQEEQKEQKEMETVGSNPRLPMPEEYLDPKAKLGHPKTLLMLWHEFMFGLDDNKPAKDFTPAERGRCKSKYSRRKSFWSVMLKLVRAGYTEVSAIDLIKQAYGTGRPVTYIINQLQAAKTRGYHPHLAAVIGN